MRIVIDGRYIQDMFPGIGRYTYNLARSLGELGSGDEIIVLTNKKLTNQRYDLFALADLQGLTVINCDIDRYLPAEFFSLSNYVNRLKPDIFHSPFFLRPYRLSCPCIVTLHDLIPLYFPKSTETFINAMIYRIGAPLSCRYSTIITNTGACAEDIQRRFKVPAERIYPIFLAADPNFCKPPRDRIEQMRRRYSLHKPYVLHVGSHLSHKNVCGLISAWAALKQRPDYTDAQHQLVLAGWESTPFSTERRLAKKLAVEQDVVFLGTVKEKMLPALYSGADLFVFPSFMEGFGFPVIEAMACETAVICSDIPSLREMSAGASCLIDPHNTEMLASSMQKYLQDPNLREELSTQGTRRYSQFSWINTAEKTHDVYRHVYGRAENLS